MAGKSIGSAGADFVKSLQKLSTAVERGRRDTVAEAAQVAKVEHVKVMRADSGGDLKLSGVNRAKGRPGNAKIGARYDIAKRGTRHVATIKATGPVQIIANDTSGRVIRSAYAKGKYRRGGRGKSQFIGPTTSGQFSGDRRAVLNIPGIGFRRSARHPGTEGKDTWDRGVKKAAPKVTKTMEKEMAHITTRVQMTVTDIEQEVTWILDWRGRSWSSTDLTGAHAGAVAEMLGIAPPWDWFDLSDLDPTVGPLQTMSLIAAFVCVDDEVVGASARKAVLDAVEGLKLDDLADAVRLP